MQSKKPILISILNWNGLTDTRCCLSAIYPSTESLCDCLVIDNGSTIDPSEQLAREFPTVECIRLQKNQGFTGGHNLAMQLAIDRGYEAILLLNNDCKIDAVSIHALLIEMRSDSNIGALSPLVYCKGKSGRAQAIAGWIDWEQHKTIRPSQVSMKQPSGYPTFLIGAALFLRCSTLENIGLLDERYFAYFEDNEISARLAQHGYTVTYCHQARAYHDSRPMQNYSNMALYLYSRNAWLFWREYASHGTRKGLFRHLLRDHFELITQLKKHGCTSKMAAVVSGFWDAQFSRFGEPPTDPIPPYIVLKSMTFAPYYLFRILDSPLTTLKSTLGRIFKIKRNTVSR